MMRIALILLLASLSAAYMRAGEIPRSVELHFAAGYSDKIALDSTTVVEMRDGMLTFRTKSGHIAFASDELTGWDLTNEIGRPLLNDVVTSEYNTLAHRPRGGALVHVFSRRIHVLASDSDLPLTLASPDGLTLISAKVDSEGRWQSPELPSGIYILGINNRAYKVFV